ncbi:MAG: hypothetical protein KDG52_09965 [Rhodocyclaceae bacterium]|nr:hypothetical protein [Rhodocyclaceae bacterium]
MGEAGVARGPASRGIAAHSPPFRRFRQERSGAQTSHRRVDEKTGAEAPVSGSIVEDDQNV